MLYIGTMKNQSQLVCKTCLTPVIIKNGYIHFKCMCDEDVRNISLNDINEEFMNDNPYLLLLTEGIFYDTLEKKTSR
jgi:hypothetical protein